MRTCKSGRNQLSFQIKGGNHMEFFNSAVTVLQTLVIALGAGLGIWGAINLLEGYGNDNPGAKSQGMKQLMAGGGVALIGTTLVPLLSGLFG
jgi:putative conjugative transfer protein